MEHLVFVGSFLLNSANWHTYQASVGLETAEPVNGQRIPVRPAGLAFCLLRIPRVIRPNWHSESGAPAWRTGVQADALAL